MAAGDTTVGSTPNCQSVVNYLGAIRNKIGDAHGQGKLAIKPKSRHAEFALNLADSMASFLLSTWDERQRLPNLHRMRHTDFRKNMNFLIF
jgi:hypothetical protein